MGVPCPKIKYPDATVFGILDAYHPASSDMCLNKNRGARCAASALVSMEPVDHQRDDTRQNDFPHTREHVTFDLWWLYVNVDLCYYLAVISSFIHAPFVRHPVQMNG